MKKTPIELKGGNFTLLVLYLNNHDVDVINQSLCEKIKEFPQFFNNAPIIVNLSGVLNKVNWNEIKEIILNHGLNIIGVSGCQDDFLKKKIANSGIPILLEGQQRYKNNQINFFHCSNSSSIINTKKDSINQSEKTHIINTPVRSGQKIYARHSDLVIINNVSAGAELVADGNIHIYGLVRGRVLAGANGDTTRKIFCTGLFAELVSISGEYWLSEQIPSKFIGKSVQIYLKNKSLTINFLS